MKRLFKNIGWLVFCCGLQANQGLPSQDWESECYDSFLKRHKLQRLSYKGDTVTQLKIRYFVPADLKQLIVPAVYRSTQGSNELVLIRPESTVRADELLELTCDLRTGVWSGLHYDADTSEQPRRIHPVSGWQAFEKELRFLKLEPSKSNENERWFLTGGPHCAGSAYCEWSDSKGSFLNTFYSNGCIELKDGPDATPSATQKRLKNQSNAVYSFFEKEF